MERDIFSMDDAAVYGPEFYRLSFAEAIENGWLADYRVVILTLSAAQGEEPLRGLLMMDDETTMTLDDATRLLGCWDALADPEGEAADRQLTGDRHNPLSRAISFTHTIRQSRLVEKGWGQVIDFMREQTEPAARQELLDCEIQHVDGTTNSLTHTRQLAWLQQGDSNTCRVLTNARCLTEGVDVPALDAVLFLHPRRSQVDVVQAVGRVMRKAADKEYGYIILPVVVTPADDPARVLDQDSEFKMVWDVLRALRSHDNRLDMYINSLDLNQKPPPQIIVRPGPIDPQLQFDLHYKVPPGAIYAKVVEKCGDRKYWPRWAEDVAQIADRIRIRVTGLLQDPERITMRRDFQDFLTDLRRTLHREPAGRRRGGHDRPALGHRAGVSISVQGL